MLATSVNEWMNEWLWCIEAQKCKTAWLDRKIQLDIRDQQECQNTGEGSRAPGSAIKDCVCCVVLSSLDFIYCAFGREWSNFLSTVTSIWVFFPNVLLCRFSTTYKSRENSPNGPSYTHHPASTVSNIFPFLFHLSVHIFFDPGRSILRQNLASCHFYLKDLDF